MARLRAARVFVVALGTALGCQSGSESAGEPTQEQRIVASVLHIALQEGFFDDTVVVRVNGDEVYRASEVKTDFRIGLADSWEGPQPEGPISIEVELPEKQINGSVAVQFEGSAWVSVSIEDDVIRFRISDRPFGYV